MRLLVDAKTSTRSCEGSSSDRCVPLPSDNFKFQSTHSDSLTVSPSQGRSGETLIVYYDFACMLEKFCLARDPLLFRNVVFMIDKFHLKNHTCSASYSYFEYDVCMLARTQVCEQGPCSPPRSVRYLYSRPRASLGARTAPSNLQCSPVTSTPASATTSRSSDFAFAADFAVTAGPLRKGGGSGVLAWARRGIARVWRVR